MADASFMAAVALVLGPVHELRNTIHFSFIGGKLI